MFELEHTRNLLYELGLNTASELLDAKLEKAVDSNILNNKTGVFPT